eukprot:4942492-Alexandrium_andersonii.AAC.1
MSASLVGSEMCIRDSAGGDRRAPPFCKTCVARLHLRCCTGTVAGPTAPVSYTHLTLPTICSV